MSDKNKLQIPVNLKFFKNGYVFKEVDAVCESDLRNNIEMLTGSAWLDARDLYQQLLAEGCDRLTEEFKLCNSYEKWGDMQQEVLLVNVEMQLNENSRPLAIFVSKTPEESAAMRRSEELCDQGNELRAQEKYLEAIDIFKQDLALCIEICGPNHNYVANSLAHIGTCFHNLEQYEEAYPYYLEALVIKENIFGTEHPKIEVALKNFAILFAKLGNWDEAQRYYRRAVAIVENFYPDDLLKNIVTFRNFAYIYENKMQWNEALPYLIRALELTEKLDSSDDDEINQLMLNIAKVYEELEQWNKALETYQKLLELCDKMLGLQHVKTLKCLTMLAKTSVKLKRYDEVLPVLVRVFETWESIENCPEKSGSSEELRSQIMLNITYAQPAEHELFQQALLTLDDIKFPEHINSISPLLTLSILLDRLGQTAKALSLAQNTLKIIENISLADAGIKVNEYEEVRSQIDRLQGKLENIKVTENNDQAVRAEKLISSLQFNENLAQAYSDFDDWQGALEIYNEILEIREKLLSTEYEQISITLLKLAEAYEKLQQDDLALKTRQRQAKIVETIVTHCDERKL